MTADEVAGDLACEVEDLEFIAESILGLFLQGTGVSVENFSVDGIGVGRVEELVVDKGDNFDGKQLVADLVQGLDLEVDPLVLLDSLLGLRSRLISHIEEYDWRDTVVFDMACKIDCVSNS